MNGTHFTTSYITTAYTLILVQSKQYVIIYEDSLIARLLPPILGVRDGLSGEMPLLCSLLDIHWMNGCSVSVFYLPLVLMKQC